LAGAIVSGGISRPRIVLFRASFPGPGGLEWEIMSPNDLLSAALLIFIFGSVVYSTRNLE